jgi:hypothetical protein
MGGIVVALAITAGAAALLLVTPERVAHALMDPGAGAPPTGEPLPGWVGAFEAFQVETTDGVSLSGWFLPASSPEATTLRAVVVVCHGVGILTGIRQLRRTRPLETEEIERLRVPTLEEMARIKAWLLATRGTVRDYLDTVVLLERLGEERAKHALRSLDETYAQSSGASVLAEVAERLAAAAPQDRASVDLASYRGLAAPWNDWDHLTPELTSVEPSSSVCSPHAALLLLEIPLVFLVVAPCLRRTSLRNPDQLQ